MGRIRDFRGLGCLVTGASSGIGREIALELARRGARLAVTARRAERLEALVAALREAGAPAAFALPEDLADPEAPARLAARAVAALGEVDILVNNAGFSVPGLFAHTDPARTQRMIQVNCAAPVALTHLLLSDMVRRDRGGVLTVSSVAGYQAAPFQSAYAASKAFLLNFSASLHQEYKRTGLAVTALCPGVTDTEFFEAAGYRRLGRYLNRRMPADRVARVGVAAFARGRMEAIPGFGNRLLVVAQRLFTRRFVASVSRWLMAGRR
jgi:short-subunit dehydrogenase